MKKIGLLIGIIGIFLGTKTFAIELNSINITQAPFNCSTIATYCNLTTRGITEIDSGTFIHHTNLNQLFLGSNEINSIDVGDFNGLNNLEVLTLNDNQIAFIESGAFAGLDNLQTLALGYNQIGSLENNYFVGLNSLTEIQLNNNQIAIIDNADFSGLSNLQSIGLSYNPIYSISSNVFSDFSSLVYVYLDHTCTSSPVHVLWNQVGYCSNSYYTDKTSCEGAGYCDNGAYTDKTSCETLGRGCDNGYSTNKVSCEEAGWCTDGNYETKTSCESAGQSRILNGNMWYEGTRTNNNTRTNTFSETYTDDQNCGIISSTGSTSYTQELINKGYTNTESIKNDGNLYYVGNTYLKLNGDNLNKIEEPTIMQSTGGSYNNISEIEYQNGTVVTSNGNAFSGVIQAPILLSTGIVKGLSKITSVMKFGSNESRLNFSKDVIVRMPALGKNIGDKVAIYYTQNPSQAWNVHKTTSVINIEGTPYVEFTTSHATYFAIGESIGSFTINNDAATTNNQNVTLAIAAPGATQMRFSNDGSSWSTWEAYATSKSRTLSAGAGAKTVYAEFDTNNDSIADGTTSDSITYSETSFHGAAQGDISLEISSGSSSCSYGTTINLGRQTINSSFGAMIFSGDFLTSSGSSTWSCTDFAGSPAGWNLTIQSSDLTNEANNSISGNNVKISHNAPLLIGGDCLTGGAAAIDQAINTTHVLLSKQPSTQRSICRISTDNVKLKVDVPANQAPGTYIGTLTITIPSFN